MIWTTTQGDYDTLAAMNRIQEESIVSTLEQFEIDIDQLKHAQAANSASLVSQGEILYC